VTFREFSRDRINHFLLIRSSEMGGPETVTAYATEVHHWSNPVGDGYKHNDAIHKKYFKTNQEAHALIIQLQKQHGKKYALLVRELEGYWQDTKFIVTKVVSPRED
jgi:hypothetical protein